MDSGCSIDTMQMGHAPGIVMFTRHMGPAPADRANRRINAANGSRIKEHGVKQLKFRTRNGRCQDWKMLVTDVHKLLHQWPQHATAMAAVSAVCCLLAMEGP